MNEFATWLRATDVSVAVRTLSWFWPMLETLHFVGMCLLLGVIGLLDSRLMGFMRTVDLASLRRLLPWGIFGFAINLVTGVLFFVGAPDQYINNPAFYLKLLFLIVAGLNALYFETRTGAHALATGRIEATTTSFKVAGALSIFSWVMVLYWGRMLPFIGNAF
ncbi:MAG: hypothetical protein ABL986_13760 [Vicinamibacterales bacterium]